MSDSIKTSPPRWAAFLIAVGAVVTVVSLGGLLFLQDLPKTSVAAQSPVPETRIFMTQTPIDQPMVERQIVAPPSTPTDALPPITVLTLTNEVPPTAIVDIAPTQIPAPTQAIDLTPISWTEEEKNALSWMCHYEVGGMGQVRGDACLSVISTVRARYVYGSGLGHDVLSVLQWPNQFNIPIETATANASMMEVVNQYQNGARGSCSGYFYFDSVSGGPSLCVIYGASNSFVEFHNGWR